MPRRKLDSDEIRAEANVRAHSGSEWGMTHESREVRARDISSLREPGRKTFALLAHAGRDGTWWGAYGPATTQKEGQRSGQRRTKAVVTLRKREKRKPQTDTREKVDEAS